MVVLALEFFEGDRRLVAQLADRGLRLLVRLVKLHDTREDVVYRCGAERLPVKLFLTGLDCRLQTGDLLSVSSGLGCLVLLRQLLELTI